MGEDKVNVFLRAKFNLDAAWTWKRLEVVGDHQMPRDQQCFEVEGAVYPEVFKSGPRKGQTDFRKPRPGTERTLVASFKDLDAFPEVKP